MFHNEIRFDVVDQEQVFDENKNTLKMFFLFNNCKSNKIYNFIIMKPECSGPTIITLKPEHCVKGKQLERKFPICFIKKSVCVCAKYEK